jgi:hypothetical protein
MSLLSSIVKALAGLVWRKRTSSVPTQLSFTSHISNTCQELCPTCGERCTVLAGYEHTDHTHMTNSGPPYWGELHAWDK